MFVSTTGRWIAVFALAAVVRTASGDAVAAHLPPTPAQISAGPVQLPSTAPVFLPSALKAAGIPNSPTPEPGPTPTAAGTSPTVVLNEVAFKPVQPDAAFVELLNDGTQPTALDRLSIANSHAQTFTLPAGLPPLDASELAVILFDGQNRVDRGPSGPRIHADRTGFVSAISETLTLLDHSQQTLDEVAWGSDLRDSVAFGSGGVTLPAAPGSAIGRLPGETTPSSPTAWALHGPPDATPGEPNPLPAVDAFPMQDGLVVAPGAVDLEWYPQSGARRYRVQLADNDTFSPVLVDTTVEGTTLSTPQLGPGEYFWRVQSTAADGSSARYSNPVELTVETATAPSSLSSTVTLPVPLITQRKDTSMLLLSGPIAFRGGYGAVQETGAHAWDTAHPDLDPGDPADAMNCSLAVISMAAAYRSGNSSQDRIGFELLGSRSPGPENDLNWGRGVSDEDVIRLLNWAVGPGVVAYWNTGERGDFSGPPSDEEREVFGATVKAAVDNGQPVVICGSGHCVIVYGYTDGLLGLRLHVNDPWSGQVMMRASRIPATLYAIPPVGATGRLDENSLGLDSDGDRIVDFDETERFGTSSSNADTDGDGLDDYQDIKLSMFDDDHGFAMDKDARDDIDGDGLAPELDFDSDDGGCSDGLEDTNRDGSISADETSPFDPEDDGCISGYFTVAYLHESETPSQMSHTEYRYDVELSMKPSEAGNVEGTGVTEWYYYDSLTSSTCDWFAGPVEVEWPVVLTGRFTDDVLSFEVVPPSKTVDVAVTGSCGGDTFPVVVNHFPGWADITFTDGKYEYRAVTEFEPPNRGGSEVELVLWRREVPPVAPGRLRAAPGLTPK